ncbi:MAG: GH92 family glycosyl hydrolase [Melioribacteraceae bacterium]
MKRQFFPIIISLTICFVSLHAQDPKSEVTDLTKYVNPLIGTAASTTIAALKHGKGTELNAQTQPSVTVPFGMTNWTPQTNNSERKCLSSYYYKDSLITGFRGSHWLSGSCTQEYGSMAIMPISGELICNPAKRGSKFSHKNEISTPNYYKVNLDDYNVVAEISATTRCGILKFTFENEGEAHIVINPNSDEGEGYVNVNAEKGEISGSNPIHRIYQGWGKSAGFAGHFVCRVEKEIDGFGVYSGNENLPNESSLKNNPNLGAYFSFKVKKGESVIVKIGTSFVSIDQARKNLDSELRNNKFDTVKQNLKSIWNKHLSKIKVDGDNEEDKIKFYTAMFHCFQQPRIYNDVDGTYPRFDGNAKTDTIKNGNYYCDFSVWDTYRALHPLFNIIIPKEQSDMINSLFLMANAGGWLPIFPKWNSYTAAMIGDHVISLAAESFIKGNIHISEEQYFILKHNAIDSPVTFEEYANGKGRRALSSYLKYGYIPLEDSVKEAFHDNEQVSRTLEYAYDDFALAQVAKKLNKMDDYYYFMKRAENYKNVFDPKFNNMNGRYIDGSFYIDLLKDNFSSFITEGTPWQYNWYVPQDVNGLMKLMGGKIAFTENLDEFFKVGQYWHGNEPSHQIPFLYNYTDEPWKTQKIVANTMSEEYGTGPGGLSGNEDAGQMSAWYVLSAIGFYPVCPALPEYQICGPKFNKITIQLGNGKTLVINTPNYSEKNIFIKEMKINGKENKSLSFDHSTLMEGGVWNFIMSNSHGK